MQYAELLSRLNTISVVIDFKEETIKDISNIRLLAPDKLILSTKRNTHEILLPSRLISQPKLSNFKLDNGGCLSFTLSIEADTNNNSTGMAKSFMSQYNTKWSCKDLQRKTPVISGNSNKFTFNCLQCRQIIIDSLDYKFQDMPSEFWYELMDFWHCHKPHDDKPHDKSYEGQLTPANDRHIIIGNHYLLVNRCVNVVAQGEDIKCSSCGGYLGAKFLNTMRLLKWRLSLQYQCDEKVEIETFPSYLFIYNTIIDRINSLATRKFMFQNKGHKWFFWVMNVSLDIAINDGFLKNTLKVLYCKDNEDSNSSDEYESLDIPYPELFEEFIAQLDGINQSLPLSMRNLYINSTKYDLSYISQELP